MCTVTYIPVAEDGYMLTSNRDESPQRAAQGIMHREGIWYPQDAGAGGTWIAASEDGRAVVLLNGAFDRHNPQPPYRMSRGQMVLAYFQYADMQDFLSGFDFAGLEPFTLIVYDRVGLTELRWDEAEVHRKVLTSMQPYLWASPMLFDEESREKRRVWFEEWLRENPRPVPEALYHWHRTAGEGNPWNDVVMNRDGLVQTVSITGIVHQGGRTQMYFHNLLTDEARQVLLG